MHRKLLLSLLADYRNSAFITDVEKRTYDPFVNFVTGHTECFGREPGGHVTGSAWLIDHEENKVLLTHHKKLNLWLQLGGHAEGDSDIAAVALKEAQEESGIYDLSLVETTIFDIDIHAIPGPCALHYDVRFLVKAPIGSTYTLSHESHALAWVPFEEVATYSSEESLLRMTQKSLKRRLRAVLGTSQG